VKPRRLRIAAKVRNSLARVAESSAIVWGSRIGAIRCALIVTKERFGARITGE